MGSAISDWMLSALYVGVFELALVVGAIVLFVRRRVAPRACLLGSFSLAGLAAFNVFYMLGSQVLVYDVRRGDDVAFFVWRWQVLLLLSAVVNAAVIGLLTAAILSGRKAPPPESDPSDE